MISNDRELLKELINSLPDGIFAIDREGKVIIWNKFLEEITGIREEDILGKDYFEYSIPFYGFYTPMLVDYIINRDLKPPDNLIRMGNFLQAETFLPALYKGKGAWVRMLASPLFDRTKNLLGAFQVIRDVTKKKMDEFELFKLKKIIDNAPVAIVITEFSGKIIYQNKTFIDYFSAENMNGDSIFNLLPFISLYEIHNGYIREIKFKDKIFRIRGIKIELEEVYGYAIFVTDITELRKYEEQLIISQKMESIRRITSTYTHDLKNIFNAIRGFAQLALRRDDLSKAKSDIEKIIKVTESATENIRRILDLGKDLGRNPDLIDLKEVIRNVLPLLRSVLGESIELKISIDDSPSIIWADKSDIEKIILNLVINAKDAMHSGGEIRIELQKKPLPGKFTALKNYDPKKSYICLSVIDNGKGMDEDTMSRIFEPFFTTKGEKGSGLGLPTVYYIVQMLNGYIFVDSKLNHGTRFDIFLPLSL